MEPSPLGMQPPKTALTIFYAWQSDRPNRVNRNFIESALEAAVRGVGHELNLEAATRPAEFTIDKDTKDVPGTPAIADTIFEKIEKCAIFIADLTFIGTSEGGRPVCNPNVLIEYGYARAHTVGTGRLVPIMNTAYGEPGEFKENLPFDLRHLREPICYELHETATAETRKKVKVGLVKELKAAMLDIVGSGVIDDLLPKPEPFPEIAPKQCRSDYFDLGETLATTEHGWVDETYNMSVPSGPKLYMRIIPHALEGDLTSTAALKLAQSGQLEPMRSKHQIGGIGFDRNKYGAIAFTGGDRNIVALAQLHKNKEIWGIDTVLQRIKGIVHHGFEEIFQSMLPTYLRFAHETLKLSFPITAEVGITGIEGFKIEAPPGMGFGGYERHGGKFTESEVFKRFVVESQDIDSEEVLQPFFETVWEEAGQTSRPTMPK